MTPLINIINYPRKIESQRVFPRNIQYSLQCASNYNCVYVANPANFQNCSFVKKMLEYLPFIRGGHMKNINFFCLNPEGEPEVGPGAVPRAF